MKEGTTMIGTKIIAQPVMESANLAYAEAIAQQRTSPGVLLFTHRRELLYTNQEALDFSARLFNGSRPPCTQGLLAPVILSLFPTSELSNLHAAEPQRGRSPEGTHFCLIFNNLEGMFLGGCGA